MKACGTAQRFRVQTSVRLTYAQTRRRHMSTTLPTKGSAQCWVPAATPFSHITVSIATLVRLDGDAITKKSGAPARFRNQPGIVLSECEAWTVVDRNSRNARVFGARYWR